MKNLLMCSYLFPPTGQVGIQRLLAFAKYLPRYDWHPIILTVSNPSVPTESFQEDSEIARRLEVYKTPTLEPPYSVKRKIRSLLQKKEAGESPSGIPLHARVQWLDPYIGWVPSAALRGLWLIRKRNIRAIYVSAPPFSSFLLGMVLSRLTDVPWISDFRDEWCGFMAWGFSHGGRNKLAERIERWVIETSSRIISVSEGITTNFCRRYPLIDPNKFVTINHGYDEDDFPDSLTKANGERTPKLRISFVGTITRVTTARYFLSTLAKLAANDADLSKKLEVHFYGRIVEEERKLFDRDMLRGIVNIHGYLPHRDCPRVLCESDVLLVMVDNVPGAERIITAKIFEYLAARRLILAIVPEGETADLVRVSGAGIVVHPDNDEEQYKHLMNLTSSPQLERFRRMENRSVSQKYNRKHQTEQLANMLDKIV